MAPWSAPLAPALASTALVFVASSLIHMVLELHQADDRKLANEDEVRAALRRGGLQPGQYVVPQCRDAKHIASPEMQQKFAEGPNAVLHVRANGAVKLGPFLGKWVLYTFIVSLLVGYVARATFGPGVQYLRGFQLVGATSWLAYAWQAAQDSIWMGRPWSVTLRPMFDDLVYAAITAGPFAWSWPKA